MRALPTGAQLYAYYRVAQPQAAAAIGAVKALHAQLEAQHGGLHCSVLERAAADDTAEADELTLMEIYTHADGIDAALAAQIEQAAQECLGTWLLGARHTEVFVRCA